MALVDLTHLAFAFEETSEMLRIKEQTDNFFTGILDIPHTESGRTGTIHVRATGTINSMASSPAGVMSYAITLHAGDRTYRGAAMPMRGADRMLLFAGTYYYLLLAPSPTRPGVHPAIGPIPFSSVGQPH